MVGLACTGIDDENINFTRSYEGQTVVVSHDRPLCEEI